MIRFSKKSSPRIAICSALYGGYDTVKEVVSQSRDCDTILFTDNEEIGASASDNGWKVFVRRYCYSTPRMEAKFPKLIPHVLLPDYDIVLWVDAQVQITADDYLEMMLDSLGDKEYAFIPHWVRDCVFDEIEAMYEEQEEKYRSSLSKKQVESYRKEKMPEHFGLWAGTSWIRRNKTEKANEIGSRWFCEDMRWNTQEYSSNDQLALAYVIWKYNLKDYLGKISYDEWTARMEIKPHTSAR